MKIIARIRSPYREKFGAPRQSGLTSVGSVIEFEPPYRSREAFRGLEGYSHIWLLWLFSENPDGEWSPTVRPPKLGGNRRVGVFASRSPFRPNPIGLSAVKLERISFEGGEPRLYVSGADLTDNTPIIDIKPYIPYADAVPTASSGFAKAPGEPLNVVIPEELSEKLPKELRAGIEETLGLDPRPGYQSDPERVYVMSFADREVSFTVDGGTVRVTDISENKK